MPGRTQPPKKRIVLPTLTGERKQKDDEANPFMKQTQTGSSGSFMSNPLTARGPFGSGGMAPANTLPTSTPVNYNPGLFPGGGGGGVPGLTKTGTGFTGINQYGNPYPFNPSAGLTYNANPAYTQKFGGGIPLDTKYNYGTGTGSPGLHPKEVGWKLLADKYGLDWNVTKAVYMRSPRNPDFDPSVALNLQLRDKDWGDAARRAGILTGDPDWDRQVWIDHYNANGDMNRDPMAGHNYAIMEYEANKARSTAMVNGIPQPPEWL